MPAEPVLYAVGEAVAAANRLHGVWREVDRGQSGLHRRPDHKGEWGQDSQLTAVGEAFE